MGDTLFTLFNRVGMGHAPSVAKNKEGSVNIRTPEALKESFTRAFEMQTEYPSVTAFFEDCMRALIQHTRGRKRIAMPLALLTPDEEDALRGGPQK